jgi:hypothetical protein
MHALNFSQLRFSMHALTIHSAKQIPQCTLLNNSIPASSDSQYALTIPFQPARFSMPRDSIQAKTGLPVRQPVSIPASSDSQCALTVPFQAETVLSTRAAVVPAGSG